MSSIRCLIIDDESLARNRIRNLLSNQSDIVILGECNNGKEALRQIELHNPDLIYLDIQMPDFTGFDVISQLDEVKRPFIIFVTAFDDFALKAFDVQAIDYLLKPFDEQRFYQSLDYARNRISVINQAKLQNQISNLIEKSKVDDSLYLEFKDNGRQVSIHVHKIVWVQSDGNYLRIFLEGKSYYIRHSLRDFFEKYGQAGFLKIHKAMIVNKTYIDKISYKSNNHYSILLKNGEKLLSGRSFKECIHEYLEDQ